MKNLKITKTTIKALTPEQKKDIRVMGRLIKRFPSNTISLSKLMDNIRFWRGKSIKCYLLHEEDKIIGFCHIDKNYIKNFAINEQNQKKGNGSFLLNYILKELNNQNHKTIYLYASNRKAKAFWNKKGFKKYILGFYRKRNGIAE